MQDSIYYIMASLARGSIRIEDGKIIEDYSRDVADIEDFNDEEIIDIYNKLFYGSNLELLKNEEYHPIFCNSKCNHYFTGSIFSHYP